MPTKPQSWKKVSGKRREENFVGRADQLKVFTDNFSRDVPNYMVLAVTGEGGVGKSTLLKQYAAVAQALSGDTIVITCDDRQPSPVTAMGYIAAELAKHRFVRKEFDERHKKYRELRQELEGDAKVPRPLVNLLARGATDLAIKSLRKVPGAGVFFEYADEREAGEAFAQLIDYGIDRWGNKDEVKLLREPETDLTPLFLGLLGDASATRRVVLMFDVFERTADTLAPWLLNLFRFEYGEFNTNVTFVISGRDPLEQHWTELAGDLCQVALEPFTLDETRQYLSNQGIADELVTALIHADTGGLPVLVQLLAATNPQPGVPLADISKDAVERFLQWTPQEDRRRVALLAAVPRQFNRDVLTAALGQEVGDLYNWLAAQSYIRTNTERGSFYHEKVRELMLRYLRSTTPGELAATHHRLANYYAYAQAQLGFTEKAAYHSETWRRLEEARVYHTISAEPDRDVAVAANAFLHAFRWRWRFAENIGQVCRQVGEETKLRAAVDMAATLLATYNAYDRDDYPVVIEQLGKLDAAASLTPSARCVIFARRGDTYRRMGQHEQALADFDRAIALDDKYSWATANRGETYRQMEQHEQALADFDRSIALDEKDAWAIASRGQVYYALGLYDEAIADLSRAVEIDSSLGWAILERGMIYLQLGEYAKALSDFDRAIEIYTDQSEVFAARSFAYLVMGRPDDALTDIQHAIDIEPQDSKLLVVQSLLQMQMGLWEPPTESPTAITGQLSEIVNQLQLAIEGVPIDIVQKQIESLLSSRGMEPHTAQAQVSRWLEMWTGDPTTLARALGAEAARARGLGHLKAGNPAAALVDFTQAIELDPSNASNLARRGRIYRQQGDYARALADYDRAIEIDPENAGYLGERSGLYLAMGRLDNALTDIQHAIDIEPQDSKLMAAQSLLQMHMGLWEPPAESPTAITGQISEIAKQLQLAFERVPTGIAQGQIESFLSSQGVEPHTAQAQASRWLELFTGDPTTLARALGADAARVRGLDHLRVGNTAEALVDFTQSIELDPSNASNFAIRGQLYRQQGDYARALADYDRAIALNENNTSMIALRGETYLQMGQYAQALADFDRAIALDDRNASAFSGRGRTHRYLGNYAESLADFDQAIFLDDKDAWGFAGRGETHRKMGQYEQARVDFDRAIELDPTMDWAIASRGETYRQMGQYAQALADFDRAIALDEKLDWAIASRGETYRQMGQYEQALADFDRAIALDEKLDWAIASRGETYRQMGQYEQALADFDRAIALDEKYAWAIASRGQTYRALSRFDDAIANLSRAIDLKPDLDWAIRERGETYRQMGQYEQALADFDRAIGLDSSDWRLYGRALIRRALGQDEPASADLRAAIAEAQKNVLQSPNDWRNKLNLAVYYVAAGDRPAAEHLYQAAIDDTIGEDLIREAMRDLDDYLLLFPDDETAGTMRARLQQYLDGRRTGSA